MEVEYRRLVLRSSIKCLILVHNSLTNYPERIYVCKLTSTVCALCVYNILIVTKRGENTNISIVIWVQHFNPESFVTGWYMHANITISFLFHFIITASEILDPWLAHFSILLSRIEWLCKWLRKKIITLVKPNVQKGLKGTQEQLLQGFYLAFSFLGWYFADLTYKHRLDDS